MVVTSTLHPEHLEALMVRHAVTALWTQPAFVRLLVANPLPPPPGISLRAVRSGAAFLTPELVHGLRDRYGAQLQIAQDYGSSEAGTMTRTFPDTPPESIGQPLPGVTARIVDAGFVDVPEGAAGELLVRAPGQMLGYVGDPDATAQTMHDGWLRTGDRARRDAVGNYFLMGRIRLRINVGGHKVAPEEIESVLEQHPGVREVVVLAAPDAARGEVVRAVIVPQDATVTRAAVQRFCRERLAAYKVPRVIEFRDALPRSPLGKVLRHLL